MRDHRVVAEVSEHFVIVQAEAGEVDRRYGFFDPVYMVWSLVEYRRVMFGNHEDLVSAVDHARRKEDQLQARERAS